MPEGRKSAGRRPKKEQRPEGEKARAAGPGKNNARRAEKLGPQAQREQRPEGEKARAAWPIKTFSVKETRPEGKKEPFPKKARAAGPKKRCQLRGARAAGPKKTFSVGTQQPARRALPPRPHRENKNPPAYEKKIRRTDAFSPIVLEEKPPHEKRHLPSTA